MKKVWTPNGYRLGPVNSLVGKGESIIDYNNGTGTLITKGQKGVDNQPSSVKDGDQNVIAGNDIDWSNGIKFSDQAAPLTAKLQMYNQIENKASKSNRNMSSLSKQTQQLQQQQIDQAKQPILQNLKLITDRQQKQHDIENYVESMNKYDKGKSSWYSRYTTSGPGKVSNSTIDLGYLAPTILERKMLRHWMKEQPIMPNIYAANKYGPIALDALNRLKVDPYNQLRTLDSKERAAYYRMQQNGGYTGGQRQAARIALALGNAKQAADILNATQLQNNQYRSQWADAALQEGNQDAARRQAAAQYGWEAYNRAHGAKTKGIETHLANIGALGQKWLQQRIKNKQYGDILNIYQQDIDNKDEALKALYGIGVDDNNKSATSNTGSANNLYVKPTIQPYEMNLHKRNIQPQNWTDKAIQNIGNLPLPDLPYQHTNYLDTIDWTKYFDAQKKLNKIITGKNGIPKSSQYTYFDGYTSPQANYLANLIPQLIPTLPDTSKYMQEYQKRMGMPMDKLRSNYNKYLDGDLFVERDEPLGYTRTYTPLNKDVVKKYGFPINHDQMIRGLMLYNNNFNVPSLIPFQSNMAEQSDRLPGFYMNKSNRTNLYTGI